MINVVNKMLKWGGGKSRIIDINPYNISNIDLEITKSFSCGEVKHS